MSDAVELTSANFADTIANGVTLVDLWAEWCGPCLMMAPTLNELAAAYQGKATIAKVNVDKEPALAQQYNVAAIPCLIVLKDGKEVKRFVGVTSKGDLAKALDAATG
ncbi:MAG TPA: thioredoxin [Candidatus Hydrogenedentes bacterium]|nr:thioredoxin [Candidatus Hydrogenedentota bacterium]HPG68842.1 thioredoxin [Candidatus Hydrogenedentota bacterium]